MNASRSAGLGWVHAAVVALCALGAAPLALVHAAAVNLGVTPAFACADSTPANGGTVHWGDMAALTPLFSQLGGSVNKLGCVQSQAGDQFITVAARKSGEGQQDFLSVTLPDVAGASSGWVGEGAHVNFSQVLGNDGAWVNTWNVLADFYDSLTERTETFFIGFELNTRSPFVGDWDIGYRFSENAQSLSLYFSAALQAEEAVLSLLSSPGTAVDIPEPATLALVGTGLLGAAAARRRRRRGR